MTENEIESMPALLESNYGQFREIIRAELAEALENGDAIGDMRILYGDFMRALSHTLNEYAAPAESIGDITRINETGVQPRLAEKLAKQVLALHDTGELGSGMLAQMKSLARLIA
jgi:hypothetical protein